MILVIALFLSVGAVNAASDAASDAAKKITLGKADLEKRFRDISPFPADFVFKPIEALNGDTHGLSDLEELQRRRERLENRLKEAKEKASPSLSE